MNKRDTETLIYWMMRVTMKSCNLIQAVTGSSLIAGSRIVSGIKTCFSFDVAVNEFPYEPAYER